MNRIPLCVRLGKFEQLEKKTVLDGSAVVQPFSDVAYFGDQDDWALNAINAPEVWSQGYTGENIVVAVIDTGIDLHHVDLVQNIWTNDGEIANNGWDDDGNGFIDDTNGWDFVDADAVPQDLAGHGTKVAGVIAAARNQIGATGVAYDARIMPIRVLDTSGNGSQMDIAEGIRYAVDNGADVINLSLGGIGSRQFSSAVQYAKDHDVLIVAASGNEGADAPDYPARYSAVHENVISVGAFQSEMSNASFSNAVGSSDAVQVDAPGVGINTTVMGDDYTYSTGTSIAAPHVTAVAALALSANPELTTSELRETLLQGADLNIEQSDSHGGTNAAQTVALVAPDITTPTVEPVTSQSANDLALPLSGDADRDGRVGFLDFLLIAHNFGQEVQRGTAGDVDFDERVDFHDFLLLARNFGQSQSTHEAATAEDLSVDNVYANEGVLDDVIEETPAGRRQRNH